MATLMNWMTTYKNRLRFREKEQMRNPSMQNCDSMWKAAVELTAVKELLRRSGLL